MIVGLEIENFKGVAARQRIDFSPLTLLFGANSAGKSTILQALLYLYELIERGSADVDRTELGGSVVELGGFTRVVHRHETDRPIVLRAEFATPGGLEQFGRDLTDFPFPDLDDEVESAWLELTIGFRTTASFRGPLVEQAVIGVNGDPDPLIWLEAGPSLREGEPLHARVNLGHRILASDSGGQLALLAHAPADVTKAWEQIAIPESVLQQADGESDGPEDDSPDRARRSDGRSLPVFAIGRSWFSALPRLDESIRIVSFNDLEADREQLADLLRQSTQEAKSQAREMSESIDAQVLATEQVRTFLEMVVIGTTTQLASFLRDSIYVGPLRTIPPRGFLYERAGRITGWGDGLAAWDSLLSDRLNLIEATNKELRRLGGGCQVAAQQLVDTTADAEQVSANHPDKSVRRLLLDTGTGTFVLPSEVGAGISQIIPVVVAALDRRSGLTLIEQPELHVHPAVQVGLGDLFIDAIMREGNRRMMLIETHSEHIILRLLRRIRETTENELPDEALPFTEDKLSVLYVESTPDGVRVRRLRVDERGEFVDRWPKGFFEERAGELF
jgi:AAA ATPase domain